MSKRNNNKTYNNHARMSEYSLLFFYYLIITAVISIVCVTFLKTTKVEQPIYYFQCVEEHIATINGQSAKICEHNDGTLTTRVYYEYCRPVAVLAGKVEHCDREFFSIELQ